MDQWAILIVGAMAVAAAWDYGRRITQKVANETIHKGLEQLHSSLRHQGDLLNIANKRIDTVSSRADDIETKLRGLASKQEMQQAAVKRGFPRIG